METMGSYIAEKIRNNQPIDKSELQEIMRNQATQLGFNVEVNILGQCKECKQDTKLEELHQHGGECRKCSSNFAFGPPI